MKIVWLSANKLGYKLLIEASKITDIEAIITLSDKATTIMYDGISKKQWYGFEYSDIKVIEIERLNEEKELLKELKPDLVIMCGWRQIIDKEILDIPSKGFIGFHPTLLPKGRGPAPIINSIMSGYKKSGLTMFYVAEGLDNGDIIAQEEFNIEDIDHASEVYEKVIDAGRKLVREQLPKLIEGTANRKPQDDTKATFFVKPSLKNNKIDLQKESIDKIYNKIRALSYPYKGAYLEKDGKRLRIWKASSEEVNENGK